MSEEQLIKIIDFWRKAASKDTLFDREILASINLLSKEIVDIIGPRRSGKSSLLRLLIKKIKKKHDWLYINFEDPFFVNHKESIVIEDIIETAKANFGTDPKFLFFDEIQNINNWEKAVRKLYDGTKAKIFITGSSSQMLSRELSSAITGRHLSFSLLPLSFKEYLLFRKIKVLGKKDFVLRKKELYGHFKKYLSVGGFPEVVQSGNMELVKQYFFDILEKDIIRRYDVRQKETLEQMCLFLLSNSAKLYTTASLVRNYSISHEVANNYVEYFKEAFLLFEVPRFSYSLKTQQKAPMKIYAVDTGLANAVSFKFSKDFGRLLENAVFLHLKRQNKNIFYYKTKTGREVDFLVKENDKSYTLIQVCADLEDDETKNREVSALVDAMKEMKLNKSTILSDTQKGILKVGDRIIEILPIFEWMMIC